ncbi:hypothetical protein, partial [Brachybacterium nesterenkovii]|uniref:hypothetical protein n=1 Tax=Brachybacterium nesterenkovii TaxID=47847 RepID=UPI001F3D7B2A
EETGHADGHLDRVDPAAPRVIRLGPDGSVEHVEQQGVAQQEADDDADAAPGSTGPGSTGPGRSGDER